MNKLKNIKNCNTQSIDTDKYFKIYLNDIKEWNTELFALFTERIFPNVSIKEYFKKENNHFATVYGKLFQIKNDILGMRKILNEVFKQYNITHINTYFIEIIEMNKDFNRLANTFFNSFYEKKIISRKTSISYLYELQLLNSIFTSIDYYTNNLIDIKLSNCKEVDITQLKEFDYFLYIYNVHILRLISLNDRVLDSL